MPNKSLVLRCIATFALFALPTAHAGDIISCNSFENCLDGSVPLTNTLLDLQARIEALEEGGTVSNGHNALVRLSGISGAPCFSHGVLVESGVDLNDSNVLDDGEVTSSQPLCSTPLEYESCADMLATLGSLADGLYTIYPNGVETQAYCDMTNGGYSYLELALGQWEQTYEGHVFLNATELQKPTVQEFFTWAFNEQGGVKAISTWIAGNCCIRNDASTDVVFGGENLCPSVNGSQYYWEYVTGATYVMRRGNIEGVVPPLGSDYFQTNPVTAQSKCSNYDNPGLFARVLIP